MNRRHFLRATGALLALPSIGRAAEKLPPKRLFAIHVPLGMMPEFFFPKAGKTSSPYLDLLAEERPHFTTFHGLSHPDVNGNHHAGQCFLSGAPHPGQPTFRNSLSLDQLAAEKLGLDTRFPSLAVSVSKGEHYGDSIAISRREERREALPPTFCRRNTRRESRHHAPHRSWWQRARLDPRQS